MKIIYPATRPGQLLAFAAATLLVSTVYAQDPSLPVIPGAKGFGIMTQAGRGGRVIKVTNLSDHDPGSLREALTATGPRTVIFETSGIIELSTPITITSGNVTVAGQTAPGLGILVKGRGIDISASDVLFQHIAIRPGGEPNTDPDPEERRKEQDNRDALNISSDSARTVRRVVVDHVSLSWSVDEVFTTWGSTHPDTGVRSFVKECTISNSIFSEALNSSLHSKGPHPMGVLIGSDSSSISLHRNLLAHLGDRNPVLADDVSDVQVANNYIYRPGKSASSRMKLEVGGDEGLSMVASFKSNVMMPDPNDIGPSTRYMLVRPRTGEGAEMGATLTLYMDGNRIWNIASASWWPNPITSQTHTTVFDATAYDPQAGGIVMYPTIEPSIFTTTNVNVPIIAWDAVQAHVLANAGSRSFYRDPVDARIVAQVMNGTGGLINSPTQVGGYPNIPVVTVTHTAATDEASEADSDDDGYSDLEEWLHGKARQVELGVPAPPSVLTLTVAAAPNNISQINLSWTNVGNETGYKVERKKGVGGTYAQIATTNANVTTYNDSQLGTGTQYYYRVRAHNANGDSGFSTDVNATTAEVSGRGAHWKLDEATGLSAADSSGNGRTGTLQLGPTWVPGKIGTGLNFDGSPTGGDDLVNAGSGASVNNLGPMTVAAWIKVDTVGEAVGRIVHKAIGTAPVNGWQFVTQEANQIGFAVDYDGTNLVRTSAANAISLGNWRHVVVTWDGSPTATNVLMYVDGVPVGSYVTTTNASGARVSDASANIYLGNEPNSGRTLDGVLDDVRVYNRVLGLSEIQAVHRAGL